MFEHLLALHAVKKGELESTQANTASPPANAVQVHLLAQILLTFKSNRATQAV